MERGGLGRSDVDEGDYRHCWLLRSCRERQRRRTAEQGNELAPFQLHPIPTSRSPMAGYRIGRRVRQPFCNLTGSIRHR